MNILLGTEHSRRLGWLDSLRGFAIILVLIGHIHTYLPIWLVKYIYGFHMPLFFLISGYIFNEKHFRETFSDYLKTLTIKYISPYFVLTLINLIIETLKMIILKKFSWQQFIKYIWGIIISRGTTEWMPCCSPLWFLTCMFITMILFWMVNQWDKKWVHHILVATFLIIGSALYFLKIPKLPWNIDTACMALFFVYAGYLLRKNEYRIFEHFKFEKRLFVYLLMFVIGSLAIVFNPVPNVSMDDAVYGNVVAFLIGGIMISIVILECFKFLDNCKRNRILENVGKKTIYIMGFDYFANTFAVKIAEAVSPNLQFLLCFIIKCAILFVGFEMLRFIIIRSPGKLRAYFYFVY